MAEMTKAREAGLSVTATLPPEVTVRLLSEVDVIARRMTRHIVDGISLPDGRFQKPGYLRTVTVACRDAVRTLVRLLHDGRGLRPGDLDRLGSMGAAQAEMEVPLEVVFSAYRVAAKVVWQEVIGQPALLNEVAPATVIAVTGTVLEYFDEISAAVGRAYLETRERLMRQRDRDRDRIMQRLLAGDASPELRRLAASADITCRVRGTKGVSAPVCGSTIASTAWGCTQTPPLATALMAASISTGVVWTCCPKEAVA